MVWVNCHHPHEHGAVPEDPWEVYWVRVEGPRLEQMCGLLSGPVGRGVAREAVEPGYQRGARPSEHELEQRVHAPAGEAGYDVEGRGGAAPEGSEPGTEGQGEGQYNQGPAHGGEYQHDAGKRRHPYGQHAAQPRLVIRRGEADLDQYGKKRKGERGGQRRVR